MALSFNHLGILRLLEEPLLELFLQAKNGAFPGAEDILSIDMPKSNDLFLDAKEAFENKKLPGKVRLKRLLPWIAYTYFLGPLDKTNNANWATKHWKGQHRLLLVPQLLRFALFSKRPRPYCELKHSVHNALQLACEPQR